jgi:probable H4MPT-linked C1 transfer pathway protein
MASAALGLDIGGANLKAAHSSGVASLRPYALWKNPDGLPEALRQLIGDMPPHDLLAVTMTGELCDCFDTKRQGVETILAAVELIASDSRFCIWRNDGRFVNFGGARADPLSVAAANWLALATFAGRFAPQGPALLIDIGSTTSDIVPISDGKPVPRGRSDPARLRYHELVYTGIRRTPVCALLGGAGAAELFATTLDVYLVLEDLPEEKTDGDTADGRPATKAAARARLARMLCADRESCPEREVRKLALQIRHRQLRLLRRAVKYVAASMLGPPTTLITAGSGEFLVGKMLTERHGAAGQRLSLAALLGPSISQAACAYAVAVLAAEWHGHGQQ